MGSEMCIRDRGTTTQHHGTTPAGPAPRRLLRSATHTPAQERNKPLRAPRPLCTSPTGCTSNLPCARESRPVYDGMYGQATMCTRITTCLQIWARRPPKSGKNIMREHQNLGDSTLPLSRIRTTLLHSVLMIKASGHVF